MNEEETEGSICANPVPAVLKIERGIGWVPDEKTPGNLRSAYDRDYVAEIERLRAELAAADRAACANEDAMCAEIERLRAELANAQAGAIWCEERLAAERERCARLELKIRRLLDENGPLIAVCREFIERWPTEEGIDNTIQRARAILLDHDLRSPPAVKIAAAIRKGEP